MILVPGCEISRQPLHSLVYTGFAAGPDEKRTIQPNDAVHRSVSRRFMADRFPANNPPRGLKVVGDTSADAQAAFEAA